MGRRNNKRNRLGERKRPAVVLGFFSLPLAALALLISCSGPFESPAPAPIAPGMGRAVISLGVGGMRTLMPETPVFVKYALVFAASGKTPVSEDLTETGAIGSLEGSGYGVDLEPGTWELTVTAYTRLDSASSYLEAAKNTTPVPVVIASGTSVDVAVTVDHLPVDGTMKGFFSWNIGLPVLGPGDSAELIYTMQGGPPVTKDLKTAPSGVEELDSGYYLVTILLTKSGKTAGRTEGAHIYPGLTTRAGADRPDFTVFTDADFVDMKYLAGTAAVVKPGSLTLDPVYVKAYEDPACAIPVATDPLSVTVSSDDKWSMKVPATLGDVYLRLETSGGGRSFNAATAHETGVPDNGRSGIALSMVIYALSQTITGPGSVGIDVAGQSAYAMEGETVALTVSPDSGNGLKAGTLLVKETSSGAPVTVIESGGGAYSFVMPAADITVTAEFVAVGTHTARRGVTLYTSLKDAIDAAPAGSAGSPDEITLLKSITLPEGAETTYTIDKHIRLVSGGSGTNTITRKNTFTNGSLFTVDSGASLTLDGSPNALVIDGNDTVSATTALITVNGGTLNMYDGVTLKNNKNTNATNHGGGVRITGGSFTMNGGTITGNTAGENGGGVYMNAGDFTMNAGFITGNVAASSSGRGGGVYVSGSGSRFKMQGGTIGGSGSGEANTGSTGGGVYVSQNASFDMTAGSITGNVASGSAYSGGGGVYISNASFIMADGSITGNASTSGSGGGGVCIVGSNSQFAMQGGTIGGSGSAKNTAANGGGVYMNAGVFAMTAGSITGNTVTSSGGGVYMSAGAFTMTAGFITENIASSNSSSGGGVYVGGTGSRFEMQGGFITGNTAGSSSSGSSSGGGVYISGTGSRFEMQGGTIGGTGSAKNISRSGQGVYVETSGEFAMSGSASLIGNGVHVIGSAGSVSIEGEATVDLTDQIYLETAYFTAGKFITLTGDLTGTGTRARIQPASLASGIQVLGPAGTLVHDNKDKFVLYNGSTSYPGATYIDDNGVTKDIP